MALLQIRVHEFESPEYCGADYGTIATGGVVSLVTLGNMIDTTLPGNKNEDVPRMRILDREGGTMIGAWH